MKREFGEERERKEVERGFKSERKKDRERD